MLFLLCIIIIFTFFTLLTFFIWRNCVIFGREPYVLFYADFLTNSRKFASRLNFILFYFLSTIAKENDTLVVSQLSDSGNDLVFFNDAHFILFASHVFILAIFGLLLSAQHNLILFLLNFEILFLGGGLMFIGFSIYWFYDPTGQIFALFLLFLAAVDSAVGLALFLILKRAGLEFNLKSPVNSPYSRTSIDFLKEEDDDTENFKIKKTSR